MNHHRKATAPSRSRRGRASSHFLLLLVAALAATTTGCTSIAEHFANHLVEKDVKALDQEFKVFEADLGLFRKCLKERGGTCQGSDTTALPHSSQDAASQAIMPVSPGSSQTLADSVAKLPAGHPAQSALAVLSHPVARQAAALHNHLRGHATGTVPGFSVETGKGAQGEPQSTATMSLGVSKVGDFHKGLLSSLGTTGWEKLHGHCKQLLATHGSASDQTALEADCRRVAFIRGYLEAYVRKGEFLEVDVQLAGAIQAINQDATKITGDIQGLLTDLKTIESDVAQDEAKTPQEISGDAGKVTDEVEALVKKVEGDVTKHFGKAAATIFSDLSGLTSQVGAKSEALAQAAAKDVKTLLSDLEGLLGKVASELGKLKSEVSTMDQKVVHDIHDELGKADAALSNVFKVSSVGFVSRDETFRARLPTLEVTLDPTAKRLVKTTDVDTGEVLSGTSDFGDLGVATDTSGVGTGSRLGAEVLRVFLEAVFDAHEGLPAVASANQPNVKPTGLALGELSLPLFTAPLGNISSRDLSRMTDTNDQVAAKTRAIISRIIAGIGPFSLGNEPLEDFIVELITTSVRHATSKATWCWYACNLDVDLKTLEADAKTAADDKVKEVEGEVKAKVKEEAEHVKLRLKLE